VHVDRPGLDDGTCYRRLVPAAAAGDPIALGWATTTHRPLLLLRGRALFEHDAAEWGSVCVELLHRTLSKADLSETKWLRRRVARRLTQQLYRVVARYLDQYHRELPIAIDVLKGRQNAARGYEWDPHPDLAIHLHEALSGLDAPTRDSLLALANHEPLAVVADRHGLSHAAVRQRLTRARKRLQPELDGFRRTAR
jgi:DNA-directed RNA polymerase specialized sigma24 family protein